MASAGQPVPVLLVGAGSPLGRLIVAALAARGTEAREAANVYDAVVALARRPQAAGVVLIHVDDLLDAEMAVFGVLRRRWPGVVLAAYGEASSGRRLAAAAAAGAVSVITGPVVNGQLDDLFGPARPVLPAGRPAAAPAPRPIQAPDPSPDPPPQAGARQGTIGTYREVLTDAEINALLGDGNDVPVAGRQDNGPPEGGVQGGRQ